MTTRADREREAYDENSVWEHSNRWHSRFSHVFESPNTRRHERLFEDLLRSAAQGKRVLELGCGDGTNARKLLSFGARHVFGVDVSEAFLARAREQVNGDGDRLAFANRDVSHPIEGRYDAIVGRAILHHLEYRDVVRRFYAESLNPGGVMVFMEPLGSNALIRLFTAVVPRAHTPDERSFRSDDLRWFAREFPHFELHPFNFVSLFAGIVSSGVFSSADNPLLRAADSLDVSIARRAKWLVPQFRQAILVVRKPADRHGADGPTSIPTCGDRAVTAKQADESL